MRKVACPLFCLPDLNNYYKAFAEQESVMSGRAAGSFNQSYEDECNALREKGQLRKDLTVQQCIELLRRK